MADNNMYDEEMNINSDADIPGNTHLSDPLENDNDSEERVAALQSEKDELKDKYLRLAAEFDNFRRRSAKEKAEYMQTAGKDVIVSLLDVMDDIDRAEKQLTETDLETAKDGVLLVFNKFKNLLAQKGLKELTSVGEDFDVEKHEAISQLPAGEENSGKVIEQLQKGYVLNDKIIRFAKVVTGS